MQVNTSEYKAYLASREWAVLREKVRKRSGNKCERCKINRQDAVHHKTYERIGCELLEDLQAICTQCHEFLSAKSNVDPLETEFPLYLDDGGILICPLCGDNYTHLIQTAGNDDNRVLQFSCEACTNTFNVVFNQRKGNTKVICCRLEWRDQAEGLSEANIHAIRARIRDAQKFLGEVVDKSQDWKLDGKELRIYFSKENRAYGEMVEGRDSLQKVNTAASGVLNENIRVKICILP